MTVRSGREKTISDVTNLYPTMEGLTGMDFKAIHINVSELGPSRHFTFVFNTFLWMTIFNFINARKLRDEKNVFSGIMKNHLFLIIVFIIIVSQIMLVTIGSVVFMCYN